MIVLVHIAIFEATFATLATPTRSLPYKEIIIKQQSHALFTLAIDGSEDESCSRRACRWSHSSSSDSISQSSHFIQHFVCLRIHKCHLCDLAALSEACHINTWIGSDTQGFPNF